MSFKGREKRRSNKDASKRTENPFLWSKPRNVFVPPLSCTSVGDVKSIAQIDKVDENSNFSGSLFVLSSYGSIVKVNEDDILSLSNVVFERGPIQTPNASYQIHRIDNLVGDVSIVGSKELYVSYYNVNDTATSGAFYSGF
ncbi:MAG: hypothetical protein CM15mP83_7930 [Flavobacteriaceae bacterium]|nr:MAG: hypothetical protein CM15mP83_7930 [Flavobacteriaceae bacterium]